MHYVKLDIDKNQKFDIVKIKEYKTELCHSNLDSRTTPLSVRIYQFLPHCLPYQLSNNVTKLSHKYKCPHGRSSNNIPIPNEQLLVDVVFYSLESKINRDLTTDKCMPHTHLQHAKDITVYQVSEATYIINFLFTKGRIIL